MIRTREYLSWSQYSLWKKSKREYWKRYGLNEDRSMNKNFAKGNELGEALEYGDDGEYSSDELLSVVLQQVPKLDFMEDKVEVELRNGEKILCLADSAAADGEMFYEYKTGKTPWTQELVEKHDQLLMYALGYYIRSGRTNIPYCKLFWIETEQTEEGLKYTGVVQEFNRSFDVGEMESFEDSLIEAIAEIEDWTYEELELDDDLVDRYIELSQIVKEAEEELAIIKLDVQCRMEADGVKYANATNGKFMFSERKSWKYSDELTKTITDFGKEVKKAQALEQKDGTATNTVSTSLRFSINKQ